MCSSPLREQIAYLSRLIGILAVAIGLIFFAISRILGVPFWEDFIFAIGIISDGAGGTVAYFDACAGPGHAANGKTPCSDPLPPISRDARLDHRDLYRQTGTLTQNRMTVRRVWLGAGLECALNPSTGRRPRRFTGLSL